MVFLTGLAIGSAGVMVYTINGLIRELANIPFTSLETAADDVATLQKVGAVAQNAMAQASLVSSKPEIFQECTTAILDNVATSSGEGSILSSETLGHVRSFCGQLINESIKSLPSKTSALEGVPRPGVEESLSYISGSFEQIGKVTDFVDGGTIIEGCQQLYKNCLASMPEAGETCLGIAETCTSATLEKLKNIDPKAAAEIVGNVILEYCSPLSTEAICRNDLGTSAADVLATSKYEEDYGDPQKAVKIIVITYLALAAITITGAAIWYCRRRSSQPQPTQPSPQATPSEKQTIQKYDVEMGMSEDVLKQDDTTNEMPEEEDDDSDEFFDAPLAPEPKPQAELPPQVLQAEAPPQAPSAPAPSPQAETPPAPTQPAIVVQARTSTTGAPSRTVIPSRIGSTTETSSKARSSTPRTETTRGALSRTGASRIGSTVGTSRTGSARGTSTSFWSAFRSFASFRSSFSNWFSGVGRWFASFSLFR